MNTINANENKTPIDVATTSGRFNDLFADYEYVPEFVRVEPKNGKHIVRINDARRNKAQYNLTDNTDPRPDKNNSHLVNPNLPADAVIKPESLVLECVETERSGRRVSFDVFRSNYLSSQRRSDGRWITGFDQLIQSLSDAAGQCMSLSSLLDYFHDHDLVVWTIKQANGMISACFSERDYKYWLSRVEAAEKAAAEKKAAAKK